MKNLNDLARHIALEESGKEQVSIAQIKEVMKLLFVEMASWDAIEVLKVLKRYE